MQTIKLEKKLRLHLFFTLLIYTALGFILAFVLGYILEKFSSGFLLWIKLRLDILLYLYLVGGYFVIFYEYWKKPWGYLQNIVDASDRIYDQENSPIVLPGELKEIELKMNQIKMSSFENEQIAKLAELKKDELVMYLAHDIKTPLTSIIGYLNLLHDVPDMPCRQKQKYIKVAIEKSQRLENLINEIFEITRYSSGEIQLSKQSVDLYYMLTQVIEEMYPILKAKGNTVVLNSDKEIFLNADPEKLARVFNNLLKNAVAHGNEDSTIEINVTKRNANVEIVFQNKGNHIPAEKLDLLFDKYYRGNYARSSNTGGVGIGLSIAKKIILLHGGTIQAQSSNGIISFIILLPLESLFD